MASAASINRLSEPQSRFQQSQTNPYKPSYMKNDIELANVSFYQLNQDEVDAKLKTACRLATQAYERSKSVFIWTVDEEGSKRVDDLLWEFPPDRFVPHEQSFIKTQFKNLVRIHHQIPEDNHYVLINLTQEPVALAGKFERVFEIVLPSESDSAATRQSHYEQINCTIQNHTINVG